MKKTIIILPLLFILTGCTSSKETETANNVITIKGEIVDYLVELNSTTIDVDVDNDKVSDYTVIIDEASVNETGNESFKKTNIVTIEYNEETKHADTIIKNISLVTEKVTGIVTFINEEYILLTSAEGTDYKLFIPAEMEYGAGTEEEIKVGNTVKFKIMDVGQEDELISANIVKLIENN